MAFHPRERRMPRRQFIRLTAYGAAAAGLAPSILAACGGGDDDAAEENGVKLSRPDAPVTLPTFDDIPAIEDGLQPETGTLKVYNYERVHLARRARRVRGRVRRDRRGHDVHQHG